MSMMTLNAVHKHDSIKNLIQAYAGYRNPKKSTANFNETEKKHWNSKDKYGFFYKKL